MADDFVERLRSLSARSPRDSLRMELAAQEQERREAEEAARRVSDLKTDLLLTLTEEQLEGRASLSPDVAERWRLLFPAHPIVDGHLATASQMQRLEEMAERRELVAWLIEHGRTPEEARAAIALEYGDPSPQVAEAPRIVGGAEDQDRAIRAGVKAGEEILAFFGAAPGATQPTKGGSIGEHGWWVPTDGEDLGGMTLQESAVDAIRPDATATGTGDVLVHVISPGWGSSGHYSPAVLEQAARDRVVPRGTQMFLDHPTEREAQDRPERSVKDLVGILVEDARWDPTIAPHGALVARATLTGPHAQMVRDLAPHVGVSIRGSATDITNGTAEGRRGPIIQGLAKVHSVDVVTRAGRGGRIIA